MPKIKLGNRHFYYEIEGKGHPLVLVPAYTCDIHLYDSIRAGLAEHFQLYLIDNRGSGQSDHAQDPYTVDDMASDTIGIIRALKLKKPHVLGSSMGSAVVQTVAAKHGDEIGKCVLAYPFPKMTAVGAAALSFIYHLRMDGARSARLAESVMPWILSNSFMANTHAVSAFVDIFTSNPAPQSESDHKLQLEALLKFDSRKWLKNVTAPILAICGEEDILAPPKEFQKLAKSMNNVKLKIIPEMGHAVHAEMPEEFNKLVIEFLKS